MAKFFLDTNAFYLLAGVTSYARFGKDLLLKIIGDNKEIYISNLTIFELLNNKAMIDKYDIIFKNLEGYDIWVLLDQDCRKLYNVKDEQKFRELFTMSSRIDLRNKIGRYVSFKYSQNISLIIVLIFIFYYGIAYYADFDKHDYYYERYQDLVNTIKNKIGQFYIEKSYDYINRMIGKGCFQEKNVKKYISDVLGSLIIGFLPIFNEIVDRLNNGRLTWKYVYSETKKWFEKLNMDKIMSICSNYDKINIYKKVFREDPKLIDKMLNNYVLDEDDSIYKKQFMKKYILTILKSDLKCKTNDFIDELIFEFYDTLEMKNIYFITLDKKYLKFLYSLDSSKIKNSIEYINKQIGDIFDLI